MGRAKPTGGAPAYQVYPDNELTDRLHLTPEQFGAYWRLALRSWRKPIPLDAAARAQMCGQSVKAHEATWRVIEEFFERRETCYLVPAIEAQRAEQVAYSGVQSANGTAGALKRWGTAPTGTPPFGQPPADRTNKDSDRHGDGYSTRHSDGHPSANGDEMATGVANVSPTDSSSFFTLQASPVQMPTEQASAPRGDGGTMATAIPETGFGAFWAEYPRKVDKAGALAEWRRHVQDAAIQAAVLAGLARWNASAQWQEIFATDPEMRKVPHARRWLHRRQWEDVIAAPRPPAATGQVIGLEEALLQDFLDSAHIKRHDQGTYFPGSSLELAHDAGEARLRIPPAMCGVVSRSFREPLTAAAMRKFQLRLVICEAA